MAQLAELIQGDRPLADIAAHLDGLDHEARVADLRGLDRGAQRSLYATAEDASPLDLDFFVPPGERSVVSIAHAGTNTLPVPPPLRRFEKRFARPGDGGDRLFGYNEWALRRLLGPGYFVAASSAGDPSWRERGAVVVDYFQVPDGEVPDGWPAVVQNDHGLQRFVFNGTRDFMRRVSQDVSIGAAFKGEDPLDHYFTLCREPARPGSPRDRQR